MTGIFKDLSDRSQLLFFGLIFLICFVAFAFLSNFLVKDVMHLPPFIEGLSKEIVDQYKLVQLISSIGIFLLPPVLAAFLFSQQPIVFLRLKRGVSLQTVGFIVLIWLASTPFLNWLIHWNESISLPDSMVSFELLLRDLEDQAALMTTLFLDIDTPVALLINTLIIAVIPALGEELLFRGVIQQYLIRITGRVHLGVWLSAFVFSLLHFQFFGFFPRMILGAVFGYLFVWSGSLWVPIIAHFLNNFAAVMLSYFTRDDEVSMEEIESIGTGENDWYLAIISLCVLVVILIRFRRKFESSLE